MSAVARTAVRNRECGAGSVLVLAGVMVLTAVLVAVTTLGSGYRARHAAAGAADLAALAAAEQIRVGAAEPCAAARVVSAANGASLRECTVQGWEVEVVVRVDADDPAGWLPAPVRRARAGVDPPAAGTPPGVGTIGWTTPVAGPYRISARFGDTGPHWASGQHTGLDFAAVTGTPVVASAAGRVASAGWSGRYGYLVVIDHGAVATYYAHLAELHVAEGQVANAGQPVGTVGSTGNSTGPHLHFEVRVGGVQHDPATFLGNL